MDKVETIAVLCHIGDDTYMSYGTRSSRTTEEYEVATLQVGYLLHCLALAILVAGTARKQYVHLTENITRKSRAVESLGTGCSTAIARTEKFHGGLDDCLAYRST